MADPVSQAGAVKAGSRYAALTEGARDFTGLVTQRSPYRDGAVPYLVSKFYGGSRFDTIWDGANREISQKMTDRRRPGNPQYNTNTFPSGNGFFGWKYEQNGSELCRVLYDGADGNIYDATAGQKSTLLAKAAGAGPARLLGINTELFIGDGAEQKKILQTAKTWQANTTYNIGDLSIDPNGNIQKAYGVPLICGIQSVEQFADNGIQYVRLTFDPAANGSTYDAAGLFTLDPAQTVALAGLTTATWLNGTSLTKVYPIGTTGNWVQGVTSVTHAAQLPTPDTGTATGTTQTGSGVSGATAPTWQTGLRHFTTDNGLVWQCYTGGTTQDWGLNTPTLAPTVSPEFVTESYWRPGIAQAAGAVIDENGNIQAAVSITAPFLTGYQEPAWATAQGAYTQDASVQWANCGQFVPWLATTLVAAYAATLDTNGNLQVAAPPGGTTGSSQPAWATAIGATTTDASVTWINFGPGSQLVTGTLQYAYSLHSIDGTVSTASPINATVVNGILGAQNRFGLLVGSKLPVGVNMNGVDEVWLWRTAAGQATLIQVAQIPLPVLNPSNPQWSYVDMLPDKALNAFISAPVAEAGDPPPLGFLPMCYALQRIWGVVDNMVVWSAGPDAVTGNGLTQFPPLNFISFIGKPYAIFPITVQDGGQVVFTSSGIWIILGSGTSTDPFYERPYFQSVNVSGYNAVTLFNQQFFVMESNLKVSSVAVQFPFQPATGYIEVGFPIGDQFKKVTTGGYSASLFTASSAFVSWNNQSTDESALYISDGTGHWFRMNALEGPETGLVWSPVATIAGGASAVQSVETSPGVNQLLLAPASSGPILARDDTGAVFADNGTPYGAWDAKGVTLLCGTGQWSETAHISAKSAAVGARPVVSVLLGEIQPSTERPYNVLEITSTDPADTLPSKSAYSDRYALAQNGVADTSDCILVKFDYGTQAVADELLAWGMLASVQDERQEPVSK
jgi:hypothetical protein